MIFLARLEYRFSLAIREKFVFFLAEFSINKSKPVDPPFDQTTDHKMISEEQKLIMCKLISQQRYSK